MKLMEKVGLALFSMIVLVISIVLLLIGFKIVDSSVFSILLEKLLLTQKTTYIMEGVCVVLSLLALRCLFFGQESEGGSDDGIILQNNDGKLLITKKTLENVVDGVVGEFPSINSAKPKVKLDKENNIFINIGVNIKEGTNIKDMSSKLQEKVKKRIKETTNLDLNSVDIEVQNVEVKTNDEKEEM